MAVLGSILTRACSELRAAVNEPANTQKLTDNIALRKLAGTFQSVLSEAMNQSSDEMAMTLDITLSSYEDDDMIPLPALCSNVKMVLALDANGTCFGQFRQLRKYDQVSLRYGYEVRGPFLHLVKPPQMTTITTLRLVYEPFGYMPLHYGLLDATSSSVVDQSAGDWVAIGSATSVVGEQDIRPAGYMGAWFRVYATSSAPTGYSSTTNNVDEQLINDFDPVTQKIYFERPLLWPTLASKGGTWSYEIVPTTNWSVFRPIVFRAAREFASASGRSGRVRLLNQEYQACMRDVLALFSNVDGAFPGGFDRRSYSQVRIPWIGG